MTWTQKLFFSEYLKPVFTYREAVPSGVRAALNYGLFGGVLVSLIAYIPVRFFLSRLLIPPTHITDATAWRVFAVMLLVFVVLLTFILVLLSQRFRASSRKEQVFTGAGVGFMFGLAAHSSLIGSVIGLLSNRDMLTFLGRGFNAESPTAISALTRSAYLIVSEGIGMALLLVGIGTIVGALLGWILLPIEKSKSSAARDAFSPFFMLVMPPLFFLLFAILVIIVALLEPAVGNNMREVGLTYAPQIPMVLIHVMPAMIGMVIVQWLGIGWLLCSDPTKLHRSLLRTTQGFYGVIWTIAFPIFIRLMNPSFTSTAYGLVVVGLSMLGGVIYLIIAQIKLRRAARAQLHISIEVPTRRVIVAGLWVVLIGCLLMDLLGGRQVFNMANILVRLIEPENLSLGELLDHALVSSVLILGRLMVYVLFISTIPIALIAFVTHAVERKRTLS